MHDIGYTKFLNMPREAQFAAQELSQLDGGAKLRRAGEIIAAVLSEVVHSGDMAANDAREIIARVHHFAADDIDEMLPPNLQDLPPDDGGPVLGTPRGRTASEV